MLTYLITGFALDCRVLESLRLPASLGFRFIDLIPALPDESLPKYALRLAQTIGFQPGDRIGGISMGGMLALEIARECRASQILLIASCTHPRFIRFPFRLAGRLAPHVPQVVLHQIFTYLPFCLRQLGMHTAQGEALLKDIMGQFPPDRIQSLSRMILQWKGCEPTVPYLALHSEGDWLIRPPLHLSALTLLKGRNHLLSISHHDATRQFLIEAGTP